MPASGRPGSKMREILNFLNSRVSQNSTARYLPFKKEALTHYPSDKQPGLIITKSYGNSICFITRENY